LGPPIYRHEPNVAHAATIAIAFKTAREANASSVDS
jgi:hypothetical protein